MVRAASSGPERLPRLGVEEEFLLLAPGSGGPLARATQVRRRSRLYPALERDEVQHEMLLAQLETCTPVCETLPEVGGHLLRLRHVLSEAALREGCLLAACAASPFTDGAWPVPVTDKPRYRRMREQAQLLSDEQLINGLHVHVEILDDEARVEAENRMRPWLPLLVALAANSPLWRGQDTGFASWRFLVGARWPVSGVPPRFENAEDYWRRAGDLVERGMVADIGQLYWLVRASARFPTLEVRACDVQMRADEAVALAGLVRALVMSVLADADAGVAAPAPPPETLDAAVWHSARHGLCDVIHDPRDLRPRPVKAVLHDALDFVEPALRRAEDYDFVTRVLERMLQEGNGAMRLRHVLRERGWQAALTYLCDQTQSL
ncbi:MAG TPA: glutamate--cysteine ligase [Actinospica sp.]|nr:glutamate--cysteine ligase [Actinospica sp.]